MKHSAATLYQKEGTKKVLASLISILAGLLVGGIAVILVGCRLWGHTESDTTEAT